MKNSIISGTLFQKSGRAGSSRKEPLRALNGVLRGRTVSGQFVRQGRPVDFSFVLTRAEYADGQLRFHGKLSAGRASEDVIALFGGSVIRPYNPWPGPSEEFRKEEKKEGVALERNEQTQSLYTPSSQIAGCEVFYLSLTPSARFLSSVGAAEKLQIGVSLSGFDNKQGEEISRQVWHILRLKPESADMKTGIEQLNRLLNS